MKLLWLLNNIAILNRKRSHPRAPTEARFLKTPVFLTTAPGATYKAKQLRGVYIYIYLFIYILEEGPLLGIISKIEHHKVSLCQAT